MGRNISAICAHPKEHAVLVLTSVQLSNSADSKGSPARSIAVQVEGTLDTKCSAAVPVVECSGFPAVISVSSCSHDTIMSM